MRLLGPPGELDDVRAARQALYAIVQPTWVRLAPLVPLVLLACGGPVNRVLDVWGLPVMLVATTAWMIWFLVKARRLRRLAVRPVPVRFFSRVAFRGMLALTAAGLAAVLAGYSVVRFGLAPALAGWQMGAVVLLLAPFMLTLDTVAWRLDPTGVDSPPLREFPDRPAAVDPLIAPREALAVCAALGSVGQLGDDLLARTLGISTFDVSRVSAELVGAQYIYIQHDGPRWWLGLTPVGRAAYRRHLRALGA